jgi:hypothetical protein
LVRSAAFITRLNLRKSGDTSDALYELESIYDYSPEADLPKIKAGLPRM